MTLQERLRSPNTSLKPLDAMCYEAADELDRQAAEIAALKAHVTEWLCDKCSTVFPPPSGLNLNCPQCTGCLRPSSQSLRKLESEIAALQRRLDTAVEIADHLAQGEQACHR